MSTAAPKRSLSTEDYITQALISVLCHVMHENRDGFQAALSAALPMMEHLDRDDQRKYAQDIMIAVHNAGVTGDPTPVKNDLAAWRSTAIAYSNPVLYAALSTSQGDQD